MLYKQKTPFLKEFLFLVKNLFLLFITTFLSASPIPIKWVLFKIFTVHLYSFPSIPELKSSCVLKYI